MAADHTIKMQPSAKQSSKNSYVCERFLLKHCPLWALSVTGPLDLITSHCMQAFSIFLITESRKCSCLWLQMYISVRATNTQSHSRHISLLVALWQCCCTGEKNCICSSKDFCAEQWFCSSRTHLMPHWNPIITTMEQNELSLTWSAASWFRVEEEGYLPCLRCGRTFLLGPGNIPIVSVCLSLERSSKWPFICLLCGITGSTSGIFHILSCGFYFPARDEPYGSFWCVPPAVGTKSVGGTYFRREIRGADPISGLGGTQKWFYVFFCPYATHTMPPLHRSSPYYSKSNAQGIIYCANHSCLFNS